MYSKGEEFQAVKRERKIELIKIDAYNLMIAYLTGLITYEEIQDKIFFLSQNKILSKREIELFLNDRIAYENYQIRMGKSEAESNQITQRMIKFKQSDQ